MDIITTPTPKQAPPENSLILPASAWFGEQRGVSQPVPLMQYDDKLPMLAVALYLNGQPFTVPDGAALNIRMDKRDGHHVYNEAYGLSDDRKTVYVAVTLQMTTGAGEFPAILELVVGGNSAGTSILPLRIAKNPVPEDAVESSDEFKTIQQIAAEVEAAAQVVQDNAESLQWIKDNAATVEAVADNAANINAVAGNAANINAVADNAANINAVVAEMDAIKAAPTAAAQAAGSAADAAQSAEDAQAAAQQARGFRTFFDAISPDPDGSLDPSRPMTTVNAKGSWTIKSTGDMLRSVEVLGYTSGGAGAGADGKVTVTVQGHTTKTADLPLTAQLLAGESVQSYVDSGCDAYIEYDGSSDEAWSEDTTHSGAHRYTIPISAKPSYMDKSGNPALANWLTLVSNGTTFQDARGFTISGGKLYIYTDGGSLATFKDVLAENPLKLWYTAATQTGQKYYVSLEKHKDSVTYAHNPVEIDAAPYIDGDSGEAGTYTVSSDVDTTVRVTLEPLRTDAYTKAESDAKYATQGQAEEALAAAQQAQAAATTAQSAADDAQDAADAATSKEYTATLTASGWTSLSGGGWQQTVTCSGMTSSVVPQPPTVQMSGTASTDLARLKALACINAIQTLSGQIRALCYEDKPTTNITISLVEVN